DRCVIEIGPELVYRVLAIGPHEELAAQTDNGLMGFTVPVMGIALTIEVDQADVVLLGPEDVIREISVAVIRGDFGYLGCADRAVPHKGSQAVQRPRCRGEALQRGAELAFPIDDVFVPQLA